MKDENETKLKRFPAALRIYRGAKQNMQVQKAKLTPDQWSALVAALADLARRLFAIFGGQTVEGVKEETPAEEPAGVGEGN